MTANENPLILVKKIESLLKTANLFESYQLQSVAASLDLTPRTLRRRLAEQHTSFSEILEKWRQSTAVALLQNTNIPVKAIAKRVGYSHPSNFERAFKRWTGDAPSSYRKKLQAKFVPK